jgi:hypothetical protein
MARRRLSEPRRTIGSMRPRRDSIETALRLAVMGVVGPVVGAATFNPALGVVSGIATVVLVTLFWRAPRDRRLAADLDRYESDLKRLQHDLAQTQSPEGIRKTLKKVEGYRRVGRFP